MRISSFLASKNCQLNLFKPTAAASACCLAFMLVGCASKPNPLIDDPSQADYTTQGVAKAAPAPKAVVVATTPSTPITTASTTADTNAAGTVQTTGTNKTWMQRLLYRFTPFRINIHQGNFISQEQISQMKEGMTREQVRFILGTPLVADAFHPDRWDYPFRLQKGNGEITSSKVTIFFKDDKVTRFNGNDLPTEQDYIKQLAGPPIKVKVPTTEPTPSTPAK